MNSECVEWNRGIAIYTAQHLASADAACGGAAELGAVGQTFVTGMLVQNVKGINYDPN